MDNPNFSASYHRTRYGSQEKLVTKMNDEEEEEDYDEEDEEEDDEDLKEQEYDFVQVSVSPKHIHFVTDASLSSWSDPETVFEKTTRIGKFRESLRRIVEHFCFRVFSLLLVLADIVIVIVDLATAGHVEQSLEIISIIIVTYFLIEVLLRIFALGKSFFHRWLEILDLVVVVVSFVLTLVFSLLTLEEHGYAKLIVTARLVRVLLFIRIVTGKDQLERATRRMISQNKRRYQKDGFDLDLTYVTERVIAMSFPSSGKHKLYRNPISEVVRFLDTKHQDHYKVYNLCSERSYDPSMFHNRVERVLIDDHNVPRLSQLLYFTHNVREWLDRDPKNVIAVHCKGGKGRTGLATHNRLWSAGGTMLSNMSVDTTHYTASHENQPWSTLGLLALAASQGGAYLGFGLQYALLTPFVLELGVPVRWASIIWLGGPITGMVVQPFVGRLSDGRSSVRRGENGSGGFMHVVTKRFGRRRPFLALGGCVLLLAQLLVGNSADLGHLLGDGITDALRIRAVLIFTLGFWLLDASNNAIWVVSKSLTADIVPEAQWPEAFSYSTAATGLGLALGYVLGGVHWSPRLPWLKTTACNDVGGCADLRFAFLLACVSCVLANLCTLLVGKESGASRGSNSQSHSHQPEGDVHTPLLEGECRAWKVVKQNQALSSAYLVTLLAWLGWISLQMYQTEFVAKEVFQGSPDQTSPLNKAYVEGVHAASRALVINALLMTLTTYAIPKAIRSMGKANLWCLATLFTALLLAASLAIRKTHAKDGASLWLALLGPVYGVQQTIPFLVVSEEAPKELLGELNGYLNVALCIPQLLVSLLGGAVISIVGSDTLLFGLGAVCDLVAAGICMKFLHR